MSGMEKAHAAGQAEQKLATLKLTAEEVPRVSTQNFNINKRVHQQCTPDQSKAGLY